MQHGLPQHHNEQQLASQAWQPQQQRPPPVPQPAVKVTGVFADNDDFDDIWMADQPFQVPMAGAAHVLPVQHGCDQSVLSMPVIDLSNSPAHKKPRRLGG